nr:hypothetical protein BaRGS_020795 [Batillaria attramentaria]
MFNFFYGYMLMLVVMTYSVWLGVAVILAEHLNIIVMSYTVLSFDNDTFTNFAFYSGIVLAKTLIMGPLTSQARIRHKVYGNPEDTKFFAPGVAVNTTDSTVERIRRCHLNDLENVVPFTLIGLLYVSAEPDYDKALMIFRFYLTSRQNNL